MGARSIDVEIYDECTFSPDALIAHTSVPVTDSLLTKGEMVDDWWPLSGQEGEEKEGLLHLILSLQVSNSVCNASRREGIFYKQFGQSICHIFRHASCGLIPKLVNHSLFNFHSRFLLVLLCAFLQEELHPLSQVGQSVQYGSVGYWVTFGWVLLIIMFLVGQVVLLWPTLQPTSL